MSILAIVEQRDGAWSRGSWESVAAAQRIARELATTASAALLGQGVEALAKELSALRLSRVHAVDHELLREYTADGYCLALGQLIAQARPQLVLFPHTYQVRDYLPKLATAAARVAVSDVIAHRIDQGQLVFTRQLFLGKVLGDFRLVGEGPHFVSLQAGAYRADAVEAGSAPVESPRPVLSASDLRVLPEVAFRESGRTVDLSAAATIVAVGRGIQDAAHIALVQDLAEALGGELAASRPICDAGWLPMERQVGSSGQTVEPKLYVAVGISGAIQHLVGMKGSRTVVAINKDPRAPIFEMADYGIVGDLFDVVPALIAAVRKAR